MSLKKSLLNSEIQTKVVTNSGLTYFAQQFNALVDKKIGVVTVNLGDMSSKIDRVEQSTQGHISNNEVHITRAEREKWDAYDGAIKSLESLISGKTSVNVVANLEALRAIQSPKVGDLVYVLDTEGHEEGGAGEALGFIYAEIDDSGEWHLFTDLEPSLHARDLTVDAIAGITGTTVQAVLESLANKIATEVARLEGLINGIDTKVDTTKNELEEKISGVKNDLAQEIEDREQADNQLQEAINTVDRKAIALEGKVTNVEGKVATIEGKLGTIEEGAQVNQNAFSTIRVGESEIRATEKTDTFEIDVTSGLLLEATGKKLTISLDEIKNQEIDEIIRALTPSRR